MLNDDKGYPGERHWALMINGAFTRANFMGTHTALFKRLRRGDRPLSYVDAMSLKHDIEYFMARTRADVDRADDNFISKIPTAYIKDNLFNAMLCTSFVPLHHFAELPDKYINRISESERRWLQRFIPEL